MTDETRSPGRAYLAEAARLVDRLLRDEWPAIDAAARLVADALADGHHLHAFGTGHSHLLAEELFYRAGGLVGVRPIVVEGLMLHAGARLSTRLERLPELAEAILEQHPMGAGDVLIVASNSGGNAVGSALARRARDAGVRVIALESRAHAGSPARRHEGVEPLHAIAHVTIDNGGRVGDAAIGIPGLAARVGPTSTVVGAAALEAVVVEAIGRLVARGIAPDVYTSANVTGGDEANAGFASAEGDA